MSNIPFQLVEDSSTGVNTVTAIDFDSASPIHQANSKHPHWDAILEGLDRGDSKVFRLFDVKAGLLHKVQQLSERVSYNGEFILWDGDPVDSSIADHLFRCLEAGVQDYGPVVKFWEKVAQNPSQRSRDQLFDWLRACKFSITEEGDILGYKGVAGNDGSFTSKNSGEAYVNGVVHQGRIPYRPGDVITMPRSEVVNDPNTHCHKGLHVGDWSYASGFGSIVLEVHVNPRDVVSIPNDESYRKMRCCRMEIVTVRDRATKAPIATSNTVWSGDVGYAVS